ncbi:hypothetical protein GDO86_008432 [Hymenochirus boettgeri]|uniref:Uncharacterized protein n=1 Tax=Hymenochirus boettgeri TaxID=247094 RepID=A0A8T2J2X7_9PIPI|nr:hypothetical protein GDO86_008432 [Hymenochirus boettgeri]
MTELKLRTLLITGSNRGIGFEFVQKFVNMQNPPQKIFATCRDPDAQQSQELKKFAEKHPNVKVIQLDATDPVSVKASVAEVEKHLNGQGLDLLINNAGILTQNTLETQTPEDMMHVYNVNVVGPMLVTQAYYPLLKRSGIASSGKSAIVDISALLGSLQDLPNLFTHLPVISYRCSKVRDVVDRLTPTAGAHRPILQPKIFVRSAWGLFFMDITTNHLWHIFSKISYPLSRIRCVHCHMQSQ